MTESMFQTADGYDRLMGRFLPTLGPAFADFADVREGQTVLDVGCGPGGLTIELARRVGPERVSAVDPSAPFVAACSSRVPGARVLEGVAETMPFEDGEFDVALASLVVGFMSDPQRGVAEMARVTGPGGTVALAFWDLPRMRTLRVFWTAVAQVLEADPPDQTRAGTAEGDLAALLTGAGLEQVRSGTIESIGSYTDLDDLWSSYTHGVGPIGQYAATLSPDQLDAIRARLTEDLGNPTGPFSLPATAWVAAGTVPA